MDERDYRAMNGLPPIPHEVEIIDFDDSEEIIKATYYNELGGLVPVMTSKDGFKEYLYEEGYIGVFSAIEVCYEDLQEWDKQSLFSDYLFS